MHAHLYLLRQLIAMTGRELDRIAVAVTISDENVPSQSQIVRYDKNKYYCGCVCNLCFFS